MNSWMYIIKGKGIVTMTQNPWFAEQRSKNGYQVYCKRSTNTYRNESNRRYTVPSSLM